MASSVRARISRTPRSRIVVVMAGAAWVGLIVDAVSQVLRIPAAAIEAAPSLVGTTSAGFLRGIAKLDDALVILLELDQLVEQVTGLCRARPLPL
jgi:purine-binding chemotaxis protein CheW